jgi:hypothetical protein
MSSKSDPQAHSNLIGYLIIKFLKLIVVITGHEGASKPQTTCIPASVDNSSVRASSHTMNGWGLFTKQFQKTKKHPSEAWGLARLVHEDRDPVRSTSLELWVPLPEEEYGALLPFPPVAITSAMAAESLQTSL